MTSTTKRAKCLSGSHSSTDGGRRYPVARSIVRKLLKSAHPETKKGRINVSILPDAAQCAKSDRLLGNKVNRAPRGSERGPDDRLPGGHELIERQAMARRGADLDAAHDRHMDERGDLRPAV